MFMSDSKMTRNSDSNENVLYYNNGNLSSVQLNCYTPNANSRSELLPYNSNISMSRAECIRLFGFYLSQILLLAVSCIYLTVVVINLVQSFDDLKVSKDPLYKLSSLTVTTTALAIFLALHGNLCQRNYDLYLYFFDIALLTYFSYLNDVWGPDTRFLNEVQKLVGFVATPIIGILVFINRQMFDQFNIIGASPSIISMYKTYCYFQALIKWDFQNMIIMANFVFVMSNSLIVNLIIFASLIVYAFLVWIIAKVAVHKESIYLVFLHVALSFMAFIWIPLQIITVSCFREANCEPGSVLVSFASLGIGAPAMIVKMWVYIEQLKVYKNFGYGLTDSAFNTLANLESTSLLYGISHSLVNNNPIVIA